ncbi:MAG: RsmG family class I SAM-dependent methyltransferase [Vicinamibacterales bacterium]
MSSFQIRVLERAKVLKIAVSPSHLAALKTYAELLQVWNRRINLTALPLDGWPDATLDRLIFEALVAEPAVRGLSGLWVDLGSGGGTPAIPLAVVSSGLALTLTESRGRKAAFLREALRVVPVQGAQVQSRFEDLLRWNRRSVALITCRAVRIEQTIEVANHLLGEDGRMLFFGSQPVKSIGGLEILDKYALPCGNAMSVLGRRRET